MGPFLNRIRCLNLLLAVIYSGISCLKEDSPHCDATTMVGSELIRTKMNVHIANATSFEEPYQDYMPLDICLSNGSLRIHWTINATKEHEAKLCYEVKQLRNMNTVAIKCYLIMVPQSYYKAELFCWFGTEHPKKSLYTHAIVTHQLNKQNNYYYNEFYLSSTDFTKNCGYDICNENLVNLKHRNTACGGINKIYHTKGVTIEQVMFNSTQCENIRIEIYRTTETELEFYLNCSESGQGQVHIIYSVQGRYCHKYFTTSVVCDTGTPMYTTSLHLPQQQPQDPDYQEITLWTTVIIFSVIATSVSIGVVLVIRRQTKRSHHVWSRTLPEASTQVWNNRREFDGLSIENDSGNVVEEDTRLKDDSIPLTEILSSRTSDVPAT